MIEWKNDSNNKLVYKTEEKRLQKIKVGRGKRNNLCLKMIIKYLVYE